MHRILLFAVLCLPSVGCLHWLPAPTPMASVQDHLAGASPARCLILLLPGFGEGDLGFREHGFVQALRQRNLSAEVISANATPGYYFRGTLVTRLYQDVVAPALSHRYEHVVVLGISMGGMGALWFGHEHPGLVTEVLLMSPYLGSDQLVEEIEKAGGLATWPGPPRADSLNDDNYQKEIWRWLQAVRSGREVGPALTLGYGDHDRGMRQSAVLAQALPSNQVLRAPGPHDWPTWQRLLTRYLDTGRLQRDCGTL